MILCLCCPAYSWSRWKGSVGKSCHLSVSPAICLVAERRKPWSVLFIPTLRFGALPGVLGQWKSCCGNRFSSVQIPWWCYRSCTKVIGQWKSRCGDRLAVYNLMMLHEFAPYFDRIAFYPHFRRLVFIPTLRSGSLTIRVSGQRTILSLCSADGFQIPWWCYNRSTHILIELH